MSERTAQLTVVMEVERAEVKEAKRRLEELLDKRQRLEVWRGG